MIQIVEAQDETVARKYYKVIADHYAHVGELAAAERFERVPYLHRFSKCYILLSPVLIISNLLAANFMHELRAFRFNQMIISSLKPLSSF